MNPSGPNPSRPSKALAALAKLRTRRRKLRGLDGVFRFLLVVVIAIWGTFLLDWSLDLPVQVRLINGLGALLLLAAGMRIFFLSPRRRLSEDQLAAEVEEAHGELDQALITAVQLTDPKNPRAQFYSPHLIDRVVREAEQKVEDLRAGMLISSRGLATTLALFGLVFLPLIGSAMMRTDLAGTYLDRNIFFGDAAWPREHFLVVVRPESASTLIAMGDPLELLVRRETGGDERVWLHVRNDDGSSERMPLEKKGAKEYRRVFRNVDQSFGFEIRSGDFKSSSYRVQVRNRPRIEEIAVAFDYPEYTGLVDVETPSQSLGGHVKVPVGTRVRYVARTSIPLRSAQFVTALRTGRETIEESVDVEVSGGRELTGSFEATRDGIYFFRLRSNDDFVNENPIQYRIAVIPDTLPSVQILRPGKDLEVTSNALLPIEIVAQDDYGIADLRLSVAERLEQPITDGDGDRGNGEGGVAPVAEKSSEIPLEFEARISPDGAVLREALSRVELDFSQWETQHGWKPEVGTRIRYLAFGRDALQQQGESREYTVTVRSAEELERLIQDEIILEGERLKETQLALEETVRDLSEVLDATNAGGGRVPQAQVANIRHVRLSQEKVNSRLDDSLERFLEIVDRITLNRLTGLKDLPKIQELLGDLHGIVEEPAPNALASMTELTQLASDKEASSDDVNAALLSQRRLRRQLAQIIAKLQEWGDLQGVMRELRGLLDRQKELEKKVEDRLKGG